MADGRRNLTEGMATEGAEALDPAVVEAYLKQELPKNAVERKGTAKQSNGTRTERPKGTREGVKKTSRGPVATGLTAVTVRMRPDLASVLKEVSLKRKLAGDEVNTQTEIVVESLERWLQEEGYVDGFA